MTLSHGVTSSVRDAMVEAHQWKNAARAVSPSVTVPPLPRELAGAGHAVIPCITQHALASEGEVTPSIELPASRPAVRSPSMRPASAGSALHPGAS